jgi:hypothetical protein
MVAALPVHGTIRMSPSRQFFGGLVMNYGYQGIAGASRLSRRRRVTLSHHAKEACRSAGTGDALGARAYG